MGRIVIACYRAKPSCFSKLESLVNEHVPKLKQLGLVTDRASTVMYAKDDTIVEVFEWKSLEAISAAHKIPAVQLLWDEFFAVCDIVPLTTLGECQALFAEFSSEPI